MTSPVSQCGHHNGGNRVLSVDILRGIAMVLVILQHSYLSVHRKTIPPLVDFLLWNMTGLAAVAFVSISGMVYSYFLYTASDWRHAYRRYAKRAAFLLLAAHPAINLSGYFFNAAGKENSSSAQVILNLMVLNFPITDMIAVCLLVAPVFVVCIGSAMRATVIIALLLSAVLVRAYSMPESATWSLLQELTFGGLDIPKVFWFPEAPWLAIFLTGSFAGYALACHTKGTLEVSAMVRMINRSGLFLAACGVVLVLGYKMLKMAFGSAGNHNIFLAVYPGQTTALLPGYLAVLALLLAAFLKEIDIRGHYNRLFWLLSVFGRTSLFTFVIQFAIVESVPALLGMKGTLGPVGFVVLFVTGSLLIWTLAYLYGRWRGWISANDYAICVNMTRDRFSSAKCMGEARLLRK